MKKKIVFLSILFCSIFAFVSDAFALAANGCSNGGEYQYCGLWRKCKDCPAGCYCPKRSNANSESCTGWTGLWCGSGVTKSNTNATISQGSFGVYACPSDYPNSDARSNSLEACYKKCGSGAKVYDKKITCDKGTYLPKEANSCVKCNFSASENKVCPGVSNIYPSCTDTRGVENCSGGKVPNSNFTACVEPTTTTPAAAAAPAELPFCGNGWSKETYESNKDKFNLHDNGWLNGDKNTPCKWYTCKGENMAFPDKSKLGTTECAKCEVDEQTGIGSGSGICYHCPDGKVFDNSAGWDKDYCSEAVGLSKDIMKYGPGKNATTPLGDQCWSKNTGSEYKRCVLGK